jgi:hypothetical protein
MKEFQSFEDVINHLTTEEIPFTDCKQDILRRLDAKKLSKKNTYRKLCTICAVSFTLIISSAFTLGYIKEHAEFVKAHAGEIRGKLIDDRGNIVIQAGVVGEAEKYENRMLESNQRRISAEKFEYIKKNLEDKLPDDKVAVFIPVKGLETFTYFSILNWCEYYYTIEDVRNSITHYGPLPGYIPDGFALIESGVYYEYENYYEPYEEKMTYKEFLMKLFEKAKKDQKDYYYKEYNRLNKVRGYSLEYKGDDEAQRIYLYFKKGKTTILHDSGTDELMTEIIERKGRKYLKDESSYYTYFYIGDDLWTVRITAGIEEDRIFRIMESIG